MPREITLWTGQAAKVIGDYSTEFKCDCGTLCGWRHHRDHCITFDMMPVSKPVLYKKRYYCARCAYQMGPF